MSIQKTEGILLNKKDLRETSLILTFYTPDFGKIKGIVRGVRGSHIQCGGGSFEIFARDAIVFYERKRGDIFTIAQCDLAEFSFPLRESLEKLAYATYLVELLDAVTPLSEANAAVYELLTRSLALLAGDASAKRVARVFEIRLLALLGIMPTLDRCVACSASLTDESRFSFKQGGLLCKQCRATDPHAITALPGTVKFMEHVRTAPFEKAAQVKVAARVGEELEGILRKFIDYHVDRRLKTVGFLREIEKV